MKTKFKKNYLSLAISSMLLLTVANSNSAENAGVSVNSARLQGNPALAPTTTTRLVSVNSTGTASGNNGSFLTVLSANGRFVAFISFANDLVANDTNDLEDVFVRDIKTGITTLASVNSTGTVCSNQDPNYHAFTGSHVLSANGQFVAFRSNASGLVANDTNCLNDVFVRDLKSEITRLVSVNSAGTASGNGNSFSSALSANGRFAAFDSGASDLVANDTNGRGDVFVRDLNTGTTRLVSVNSTGTDSGNGSSGGPELSADGRFVAFGSGASDLAANDTNGRGDIFVRDLQTGTTTLASFNSARTDSGNESSFSPVLSADGRFVAFYSDANDLAANDTNGISDLFLRDLKTGTTRLVTINSSGTGSGNGGGLFEPPVLSANGRFVAFNSDASDLVTNDTNGVRDVFMRDMKTGVTSLASVNSTGTASGNGVSANTPALSADGRFLAFNSLASDLVSNDTNGEGDVFVRDLKTGTTKLVSVNSAGTATGNQLSTFPAISADGRFVGFTSQASDLVATVFIVAGTQNVYVRPVGR